MRNRPALKRCALLSLTKANSRPSNRARGLGVVNAALSSGFVFGPALGALIAAYWGPRAPFFVAAGISLITISLSIFLLPESLTPERRREDADRRAGQPMSLRAMFGLPGMAALMAVAFSAQLAFFGFQATYVLWTEKVLLAGSDPRVVQQAIGGILTFVGVCGIITQVWLVGPLVRRYGERMLVAGGVVLRALGWALMAAIPVLSATLVAIPLLAAGQGILLPALGALVTYLAPRQRGQAIGLLESSQGFGRVTGPLIAGVLFDQIHPSAPLVAAAILSVGTALASTALWRVPLKKEASAEPR